MKNAGKACNNRLYRHIRTFEKIVKNYFVIYITIYAFVFQMVIDVIDLVVKSILSWILYYMIFFLLLNMFIVIKRYKILDEIQ